MGVGLDFAILLDILDVIAAAAAAVVVVVVVVVGQHSDSFQLIHT